MDIGEIFGTMYCWFENFFGLDLADYMWGDILPFQSTSNMFVSVGWSMLAISAFLFLLYYYIINHPRLCHWWAWMLFWLVNGVVNFIVGWSWTLSRLNSGDMDIIEPGTGNIVSPPIDEWNCLYFGIANAILSLGIMLLLSIAFKWWSKNCSRSPFVK